MQRPICGNSEQMSEKSSSDSIIVVIVGNFKRNQD